jgi:hypothetical protein
MTDPTHSYDGDTPPEKYSDIGPYYAGMGLVILLASLGLIGWREVRGVPWTGWGIAIHALLFVALALLIRPRFIDRHIKDIAHALPTAYKKPPDNGA